MPSTAIILTLQLLPNTSYRLLQAINASSKLIIRANGILRRIIGIFKRTMKSRLGHVIEILTIHGFKFFESMVKFKMNHLSHRTSFIAHRWKSAFYELVLSESVLAFRILDLDPVLLSMLNNG